MFKPLFLASFLIMLSACGENTESTPLEQLVKPEQLSLLEQYRNQTTAVLNIIHTNEGAASLEAEAAKLVKLSQLLLNDLAVKVPQCKPYLISLNAAAADMANLPVEKVTTGYLSEQKLPNFDKPICYHIKELLVHGAAVQVIARKGVNDSVEYKTAELDIIEAMAHFDQVEVELAD